MAPLAKLSSQTPKHARIHSQHSLLGPMALVPSESTSISDRHAHSFKSLKNRVGAGELNLQPYWGFDDLPAKARSKLHNCFYVQADSKWEGDKEFLRYAEIQILTQFSFDKFLSAIEAGAVLVDFDARTGHNHGTKFRLRQDWLPELYAHAVEV